jgi:hypothetical protein
MTLIFEIKIIYTIIEVEFSALSIG